MMILMPFLLLGQLDDELIYDSELYEKESYYFEAWIDTPIYINQISRDELIDSSIFSDLEIDKIIEYRVQKPIDSIAVLQTMLNDEKIEMIKNRLRFNLPQRYSTNIKSYTLISKTKEDYYYQKLNMQNKEMRMSVVAENVPHDPLRFDFYKLSASYTNSKMKESVHVGAFSINSGNSLLFGSSPFFRSKTVYKLQESRVKQDLSRTKYVYLNGIATKINVKNTSFLPFVSISPFSFKADSLGRIKTIVKTGNDENISLVNSHVKAFGLISEYKEKQYLIGANVLWQDFANEFSDANLKQKNQTFSQYGQFFNDYLALRYEYAFAHEKDAYHIETLWHNKAHSLKIGYRDYQKYFPENYATPYSVRADFRNEKGIYSLFNTEIKKLQIELFTDNFIYSQPEGKDDLTKRGTVNKIRLSYPFSQDYRLSLLANHRKSDLSYQNEMTLKRRNYLSIINDIFPKQRLSHQVKCYLISDKVYSQDEEKEGFALVQKTKYSGKQFTFSSTTAFYDTKSSISLPNNSVHGFASFFVLNKSSFLVSLEGKVRVVNSCDLGATVTYQPESANAYKAALSVNMVF